MEKVRILVEISYHSGDRLIRTLRRLEDAGLECPADQKFDLFESLQRSPVIVRGIVAQEKLNGLYGPDVIAIFSEI